MANIFCICEEQPLFSTMGRMLPNFCRIYRFKNAHEITNKSLPAPEIIVADLRIIESFAHFASKLNKLNKPDLLSLCCYITIYSHMSNEYDRLNTAIADFHNVEGRPQYTLVSYYRSPEANMDFTRAIINIIDRWVLHYIGVQHPLPPETSP